MDQEGQSSHVAYLLHKLRYINILENMHQSDYAGSQMGQAVSVQGQSIIKRRTETTTDLPEVLLVQVKSSSTEESDGEVERSDTQRRAVLQGVLSHLSTDLVHELMDMLER
jgi:hypothetical protein